MAERTNAGYTITDSLTIGESEFVIGKADTAYGPQFVTWECKNKDNYFWGHYLNDRRTAEQDLVQRATERLSLLATLENKQEDRPPKKKERER